MSIAPRLSALACAALLAAGLLAAPATAPMASAQDMLDIAPRKTPQEVNDFKLTEDFLARMEKAQQQLADMELAPTEEEGRDLAPSIDAMVASVKARPQVMAALKSQNLDPRDYIVGYFALTSSLAAAEAEGEQQLMDETKGVNPEHIAFAKKYNDRIRQLIGE